MHPIARDGRQDGAGARQVEAADESQRCEPARLPTVAISSS
jgi:hypothetical protein